MMRRKEMREVEVTYCDICDKKLEECYEVAFDMAA